MHQEGSATNGATPSSLFVVNPCPCIIAAFLIITQRKKSCIWETLSLLMCADSSTNTKTDRYRQTGFLTKFFMCQVLCVRCHLLCVTCHMSGVTCHMALVTCHLSLTPTATAIEPPLANSSIMMAGCKDQQTRKMSLHKKSLKRQNHKNV